MQTLLCSALVQHIVSLSFFFPSFSFCPFCSFSTAPRLQWLAHLPTNCSDWIPTCWQPPFIVKFQPCMSYTGWWNSTKGFVAFFSPFFSFFAWWFYSTGGLISIRHQPFTRQAALRVQISGSWWRRNCGYVVDSWFDSQFFIWYYFQSRSRRI